MPGDINIDDQTLVTDPYYLRTNNIRVNGKHLDGLAAAYRRGTPASALPKQGIQETFWTLEQPKLDALGSTDEQREFLRANTTALGSKRINLFFTRLKVNDPELFGEDQARLVLDLLSHPQNDVLAIPTVDLDGVSEFALAQRIAFYERLTTKLLQANKDTHERPVAMTVPPFYGSMDGFVKRLGDIFTQHQQKPNFFISDFGAHRYQLAYAQINPLHRLARKLHPKGDYALYAANLAPAKRSSEVQPAEDLLALAAGGINFIGPKRGKPAAITKVPGQSPYASLPKVFTPNSFEYAKTDGRSAASIAAWFNRHAKHPLESPAQVKGHLVQGFNATRINEVLEPLSASVAAQDKKAVAALLKGKSIEPLIPEFSASARDPRSQSTLF